MTLFPEDFLASHSVQPGSDEARRMTVTSGRKCCELYRKSGLLGSLVRTLLVSSAWRSTRCYLTWKASATPARRLLFRLVPSIPHTEGAGSQFWPTPTAMDARGLDRNLRKDATGERSILLSQKIAMFPTPTARDYKSPDLNPESERFSQKTELNSAVGGLLNPTWVEWLMGFPIGWTDLSASETP